MKKKMWKLWFLERDYLDCIIKDMDKNPDKYPPRFPWNRNCFSEIRESNIISMFVKDAHQVTVVLWDNIIIGSVYYSNGKRYNYKVSMIYDRETKKYEDYLEFSREYKNRGHGYYEQMTWEGTKIIGEND